ncbi:hypothetical protein BDA96_01G376900 [Sorghum bicolor]|uniref:Uncharacterized protein n=1 Tax=Sorghum bicolor TaxID=4558 RepID=A0A921S3F8_SORBI|nr:hypothetical protein BDA96_04G093300 [Sorghum bicolor]KAG0550893.1 hypothetical protein BDA96_01G376900 [Sorghum bicolor]
MRKGSLNAACSVLKLLLPSLPCICRGSTLPIALQLIWWLVCHTIIHVHLSLKHMVPI